jgi:hypothetical protein
MTEQREELRKECIKYCYKCKDFDINTAVCDYCLKEIFRHPNKELKYIEYKRQFTKPENVDRLSHVALCYRLFSNNVMDCVRATDDLSFFMYYIDQEIRSGKFGSNKPDILVSIFRLLFSSILVRDEKYQVVLPMINEMIENIKVDFSYLYNLVVKYYLSILPLIPDHECVKNIKTFLKDNYDTFISEKNTTFYFTIKGDEFILTYESLLTLSIHDIDVSDSPHSEAVINVWSPYAIVLRHTNRSKYNERILNKKK